jgi:hypothetical protein
MLLASCVAAGLIASQAVYYDDDGDPTGVRHRSTRLLAPCLHCACCAVGGAVVGIDGLPGSRCLTPLILALQLGHAFC